MTPIAAATRRPSPASRRRRLLGLLLAIAAPIAAAPVAAEDGAAGEESWFVFAIADVPVGFAHERVVVSPGNRLTEVVLEATLERLGSEVPMRFAYTFREGDGGELAWLRSDVALSQQTVRLEAFVEPQGIRLVSTSGGDAPSHERVVERGAAPLLGPQAVRRLGVERLAAAGDTLEYATFSPELQRVVGVSRRVRAAAVAAPCAPQAGPTTELEELVAGVPGARALWVDARGEVVQETVEGPFGPMTTCRASRAAALAAAGGGTLPGAMYERTMVRANLRLADPFAVDRLLLRVRPRDPSRPLPDLAAEHQAVTPEGDGWRVEIRRPEPPAATAAGDAATAPQAPAAEEYREPNALVGSDHPQVVAIAREVAADERDPWLVAQRLTRWVSEHLTLDLGVVMAPAAELVRDRRATCVGYATLLAALTRAAGIPSRVAMGAVYYGGIWGGHAWTEVWVDGRWLPLDAAVYAPGVASAVRLKAGTSSLQDGGGELTLRLGQLFGNVDVEIVEVTAGGRTMAAAAGAAAYAVEGSTYLNPGLGLRVEAAGWTVEDADSTWPATRVVAFRRGDETVELHELPAASPRLPAALAARLADGQAVQAVRAGGTVWLYAAAGPRPEASLRELLATIRGAG